MTTKESIAEFMKANGLEVRAVFVPFSKSRNAANKDKSLNWRVTLTKDGRDVITTDYSAGIASCPAYKLSVKQAGNINSVMRAGMIEKECETGRAYVNSFTPGRAIMPESADVLSSLAIDSDALDYTGFEEWAANFGYDVDSRKAETIYKACLEASLKMRNGLGEKLLADLREAVSGY